MTNAVTLRSDMVKNLNVEFSNITLGNEGEGDFLISIDRIYFFAIIK